MQMRKSTRHSRITGDFAESLVLYWLSKYGFECARVDHTGIDLIARNPHTKELMGISVKSRSRNPGTERTHLAIARDELPKIDAACDAFGCVPYFAVVVDAAARIRVFILPKARLVKLFPPGRATIAWKMSPAWLERYATDPEIKTFHLDHAVASWWGTA